MTPQNRIIIVTGAGGGIGKVIARTCHQEGANVVIAGFVVVRKSSKIKVGTRR